ncbi:MAG: hypothetical protein WBG89_05140 [Ornithinimicrobium sp.]
MQTRTGLGGLSQCLVARERIVDLLIDATLIADRKSWFVCASKSMLWRTP